MVLTTSLGSEENKCLVFWLNLALQTNKDREANEVAGCNATIV